MALSTTVRNSILLKNLHLLNFKVVTKCLCSQQETLIPLESDVLDNFTTQLMQRKSTKWEIRKKKLNRECIQINHYPVDQIHMTDSEEIDNLLQNAIDVNDTACIIKTIEKCIKHNTLPCMANLTLIFSHFADSGDKGMVLKLIELSTLLDSDTLKKYSHFKHYLAKAIWVKGNISEAIILFEQLYSNNIYLRHSIRNMLKCLLTDSTINRSEAVLFIIINFAKRLGTNYKDFYPLACIWKCCILSEWFTDQSIALELLEQVEGLRKAVMSNISYIVLIALKTNQIDLVYRLLEVLIRCEPKTQYTKVVGVLFDYKVSKRDLQGCLEIIQWCRAQEVSLSTFQQEQLVNLLLHSKSKPKVDVNITKLQKPPDYQFNF